MENEEEHIKKCVDQAVSYVEKHVDVQICMGIGSVTYGISKIIQSVKEARRQADQEKKKIIPGRVGRKEDEKRDFVFFQVNEKIIGSFIKWRKSGDTTVFFGVASNN